jgi:DNA gyrase subunit A
MMATKNGVVKKTELSQFEKIRANGLVAIKLDDGDELTWVKATTGEDEVILVTHEGRSIDSMRTIRDLREEIHEE